MARPVICLRETLALAAFLTVCAGLPVANAVECKSVRGSLEESQVTGPGCSSAVDLCTIAQMSGQLKGQARFTATAITVSADTPTTGVVFVVGDTLVADAQLAGKLGSLVVKNAASFRTTGDGDLTDTQVIVAGTGDFIGATGSLRVSGTFTQGSGVAGYEGSVCLP